MSKRKLDDYTLEYEKIKKRLIKLEEVMQVLQDTEKYGFQFVNWEFALNHNLDFLDAELQIPIIQGVLRRDLSCVRTNQYDTNHNKLPEQLYPISDPSCLNGYFGDLTDDDILRDRSQEHPDFIIYVDALIIASSRVNHDLQARG